MIESDGVQPNARELRPIRRGWGAIHWICIPQTYAFLLGFVVYGSIVGWIAEDFIPPFLFSGVLIGSFAFWVFSAWAARRVASGTARRTPTGDLPWKWWIGPEGFVIANGLLKSEIDWRAVKTVREESDRILFLVTPANNPVLPKRLLSEGQLAELQDLIADVTASGRLGRGVD